MYSTSGGLLKFRHRETALREGVRCFHFLVTEGTEKSECLAQAVAGSGEEIFYAE